MAKDAVTCALKMIKMLDGYHGVLQSAGVQIPQLIMSLLSSTAAQRILELEVVYYLKNLFILRWGLEMLIGVDQMHITLSQLDKSAAIYARIRKITLNGYLLRDLER